MKNSKFQKNMTFSVKELAYLALLVAACVVGRILFQPIPNVQPMTAIFLIITSYFDLGRGLMVSLLSVIITNLYMGMGVWTIAQLLSYTLVLFLFRGLLAIPGIGRSFFAQIMFSFFAGFFYGFVISIIDVQIYGMPTFFPYYFQGLSFDLLHGVGNIIFFFLLTPVFQRLLKNIDFNQKNTTDDGEL